MSKFNFKKSRNRLEGHTDQTSVPNVPDALCVKCPSCKETIFTAEMEENDSLCPKCQYHFRLSAEKRVSMICDEGTFTAFDEDVRSCDPLKFPGYAAKLKQNKLHGRKDEVITGKGKIDGQDCCVFAMEPAFMIGSMGSAVGEKITRLFEYATRERLPVVGFTASGGARMQEGMLSLTQMAKTSGAVKYHSDAGLLYITVLTDPTTGGVTASYAMEGDILLAEPGALIAFAGPRVIEQTLRQKLPKNFQRAEFLLEKGFLDAVIQRPKLKSTLAYILRLHGQPRFEVRCGQDEDVRVLQKKERPGDGKNAERPERLGSAVTKMAEEVAKTAAETVKAATGALYPQGASEAYDVVKKAREPNRASGRTYIKKLCSDFIELRGDRRFADDHAIIGGVGHLCGIPVTVIAQEKGGDIDERARRNFGMAHPEGYRKSLRLMKQAEKFGRPVLCLVDTSGAYCGIGAEERGQGQAIAENLMEMMTLRVPVITVLLGEGGSGGALALAVADRVWMMENSVYSVISPEGCASILYKNAQKAAEAAACLKITPADLKALGIIEEIIPEGDEQYRLLKNKLTQTFLELLQLSAAELCEARYRRFREIGVYEEG